MKALKGLISEDEILNFGKSPITFRDDLWTRAAAFILEQHKPNLLLMHLLTTDSISPKAFRSARLIKQLWMRVAPSE